jgi:hypothetical protein
LPNQPKRVAGGGGPPYDDSMDRRLTILETRFDTILPGLATKQDLELVRAELRAEMRGEFAKLRLEMHEEFAKLRLEFFNALNSLTKWMITLCVSLFLGIVSTNLLMFNSLKNLIAGIAYAPTAKAAAPPAPPVPAQER